MSFQPKKILVATDFSSYARSAADAAISLAKLYGAQVTLMHVVPLSTYVEFAGGVEGSTFNAAEFQNAVREGVAKEAKAEVKRLQELGCTAEFVTADGPAAIEVCTYAADKKFDLVIVGSHGRTGVKRLLLGSVAEVIVRHAQMPVLTVRG